MSMSSNPFSALLSDGRWGEIGGMKHVDDPIKLTPQQKHDAQLTACEIDDRRDAARPDTKELLSMLGIDERVVLDDGPGTDDR